MRFSIVVPVFNRPIEVDELLESLTQQTLKDFEVIIVEDGSEISCKDICAKYDGILNIKYLEKENSGPGQSRNYGARQASGDFLLILDSDVVLPEGYIQAIEDELQREDADAFGGPDASHPSFSDTQKAISYSMTSFFTTGGIRGGKKKLDKFYPRSFNVGVKREVYEKLGGFSDMRFGEDIDFSIRIFKAGYKCRLFPEAWVWHKRRTDLRKFYRQVFNSGIARINLYKKYPESLKLVHILPSVFTIGVGLFFLGIILFILGVISTFTTPLVYLFSIGVRPGAPVFLQALLMMIGILIILVTLLPLLLFSLLIFIDSSLRNKSIWVGILSVPASFVQLTGYGMGFLKAWWRRCVRGLGEFSAFKKSFYK